MIKIAPDGYPYIFGSLLITIVVSLFLLFNWRLGHYGTTFYVLFVTSCSFFTLTIFMAFFFRDPERNIPEGKGIFVAPADGKVILIEETYEKDYLEAESKEVSIFMSLFDVHVNRVPNDGSVAAINYAPGKFIPAYKGRASIENENTVVVLDGDYGRVLIRQVAGILARRIVCRVKVGDKLKRGKRYGMIKFGSRLDIYLPKDTQITVALGDKVKAGETIIGKL